MSVGTTALIAAGIGAAGTIGSSLISGNAAKNAANQQAATDRAAGSSIENLSQLTYDNAQKNISPYLAVGQQGAQQLQQAFAPGGALAQQFSFDPSQIANNPNYQFVLAQGNKAVQQSAAAQGGLFSGGTLKALDQYSQGLATQTVNDAYAQAANTFQMNHNNLFQGYTAETGIGQGAVNQTQAADALRANTFESGASAYMDAANASAAGTLAQGQAYSNALNGITNIATTTLNPGYGLGLGQAPGTYTPAQSTQAGAILNSQINNSGYYNPNPSSAPLPQAY